MERTKVLLAVVAAISPLSQAAMLEPADMEITRGLQLTPTLGVEFGFDDNTTHDDDKTDDSSYLVIAPRFKLSADTKSTSEYYLSYELNDATYFSSDEDDYTDHFVEALASHEFTARHRLRGQYNYERMHDARGLGITEGQGANVNSVAEQDIHRAFLRYGFGARSARFNIDVEAGYYSREFANFRSVGKFRDYDKLIGIGTFYWNLAPKTSALIEWRREEQEYDQTAATESSRDSTDDKVQLGLRWDATYKTTGILKLGYQSRDFDSGQREDFDGFSGLLGVEWRPRSYSMVIINGGYSARDPDTFGDYIEEATLDASWKYAFNERLYSQLGLGYTNESYTGVDRDDDSLAASISGVYLWRRWFEAELGFSYEDQNSDLDEIEYDNSIVFLALTMSL